MLAHLMNQLEIYLCTPSYGLKMLELVSFLASESLASASLHSFILFSQSQETFDTRSVN
jgi:hypothetical protein